MDNTNYITHLSLCAGYAGIDLGLTKLIKTIRTVAFVEIEAYCIANLVTKIESGFLDQAPIYTDIKTFPYQSFSNKIDILTGGFPCQPFSAAGKQKADSDPRHLWPYIVKGIVELNYPPILFFENVEGIISSKLSSEEWSDEKGTPVLLHVLREMERLGYKATAGIFSAREVGAPHKRKRVFIMGLRSDFSSDLCNQFIQNYFKKLNPSEYPASRFSTQFSWEPPRSIFSDVDNSDSQRLYRSNDQQASSPEKRWQEQDRHSSQASSPLQLRGQVKPSLDRDSDGLTNWLDQSSLFTAVENFQDEIKLLGNGVVPDVAAKAFLTLFNRFTI